MVWVTAIAPYVILLILFIRGIFLPGAVKGVQFYMSFDLRRLLEAQVGSQVVCDPRTVASTELWHGYSTGRRWVDGLERKWVI